jgi:hypothetical protein
MVSNNEEVSEYSFHKAMDTLIDKTKVKMENTPSSKKDI